MSKPISTLDLLVDLSLEEQQLLSGGQDTPGGVDEDLEEPDDKPFEPVVPSPDKPRRNR
ncbi:MAG TPA: hypothetical protein VE956_00930 [Nodularia sp. (in: cyanobacteria)]|nr:hypothetical protein [Nodularia sp. (in: cyanobacteria)]